MYTAEFYRDRNNKSDIVEYLDELKAKSLTSKHERIIHNKILSYIGLLEKHGTYIGEPVVKHVVDDI